MRYTIPQEMDYEYLNDLIASGYFSDRNAAKTDATVYVLEKMRPAPHMTPNLSRYNGYAAWWLRSPGPGKGEATLASSMDGETVHEYHFVEECIRPAIWVLIDSLP